MTTLRRWVLAAALAVLAAGVATGTWQLASAGGAIDDLPLLEAVAETSTTSASAAATTVTAPPLPMPVPAPVENYIDEPATEIGRIEIPAIGLDHALFEGVSLTAIDHGPSHWPGSALPGRMGNVVIAGHRVTRTHPFRNLDQLVPGDQAILTTADGAFTYEFTGHEIVTPDRVDIVNQTSEYRATFFACHPPGSARYRIVAYWRLLDSPVNPPTP